MGAVVSHKTWGLVPKLQNIPQLLKRQPRWVLWRAVPLPDGRKAKRPYQPTGRPARVNDRASWSAYDKCEQAYLDDPTKWSGLGFVLTGAPAEITVLDLDKCVTDDRIEDWAMAIVKAADSYTELSPSGRGLRIITRGDAGAFINADQGVEVYTQESTRFLTITGHVLKGYEAMQPALSPGLLDELEVYRPVERTGVGSPDPITDSPEHIEKVLSELVQPGGPYEGYEAWLKLGMALHHQYSGHPEGLEMWHRVCAPLAGYEGDELDLKWDTFGGGGRQITLRSIFADAQDHGIRIRESAAPATFEDFPDLDGDSPAPEAPKVEPVTGPRTLDQLAHTKPPKQLIEDLLARGQVSQISGEPGAGKTFVALELCRAVATGTEAFGRRTAPGAVLYLAYEGVSALEQRVRAWQALGRKLPDNFWVVGGKDAAALTDPKAWQAWLQPLFVQLKPKLLVIDTMAAATPGMSFNDEERVGAVVRTLRALAERTTCHIMTIHHPPKGGAMTGQKSRGSGIVEGDLDTQLWVTNGEGSAREWEVSKQRSLGSYGNAHRFVLKTVYTGMQTEFGEESAAYLDQDVKEADNYAPELLDLSQRIADALRDSGNVGLNSGDYNTVVNAWLAEHHARDNDDQLKRARSRAKRHLAREFAVTENGSGKVTRVEPKQ